MNSTLAQLVIALALLGCLHDAGAREIFRCRTPDGALAFGDVPCPEQASERETITLANPAPAGRQQLARRSEARAGSYAEADARRIAQLDAESRARLPVSLGGKAPPPPERTPRRAHQVPAKDKLSGPELACANAKSKRERAYRERGNSMDFDARRRLQDQMIAACGLR